MGKEPPRPAGTPPEEGNLRSVVWEGSFPWMLFCVLTLWLIVAGTDNKTAIEFIKLLLFYCGLLW